MTIMDQMTKMTMNSERTKYMEYLRLLTDLNNSGYRCTNEIKETLDKLHGMMFEVEEKIVRKYHCYKCETTKTRDDIHDHKPCTCDKCGVAMVDWGIS